MAKLGVLPADTSQCGELGLAFSMTRHNFLPQAKGGKRSSANAAAKETISAISSATRLNLRKALLVSLFALASATTIAVSSYVETRQNAAGPVLQEASSAPVERRWTLQSVSRNATASQQNTYAQPLQLLASAQTENESVVPELLTVEGENAFAGNVALQTGEAEPSEPAAGGATESQTFEASGEQTESGAEAAKLASPDDEAVQASQPPSPPAAPVLPAADGLQISHFIPNVNVTFYDCLSQGFCGYMYGGKLVYEGAAACSWNLPLGTLFTIVGDPTQRVYVCEDRGLLPDTWVDIFWYDPADGWVWQASVGRHATIEILVAP